jgi:allantoin racemase
MTKIVYLRPVADSPRSKLMADHLTRAAREGTEVSVVSLSQAIPTHLEYHAYEALALAEIVGVVRRSSTTHDAVVLGGFYDMGLRAAREISGRAVVTAACESACTIARQLANRFSILVGREKWIPRVMDNVDRYGHRNALASIRPVGLGVEAFHSGVDPLDRFLSEGRQAVDDGAEAIVLGCTAFFGLHERMQAELGVPVIDAMIASLRMAELLAGTAADFDWRIGRTGGYEPPPEDEIRRFGLFEGGGP